MEKSKINLERLLKEAAEGKLNLVINAGGAVEQTGAQPSWGWENAQSDSDKSWSSWQS